MPWVPVVYDTRADRTSREFWILQEYFPHLGWPGWKRDGPEGRGEFSADPARLHELLRQVAVLHAYSRQRIDELHALFPSSAPGSVDACPAPTLRARLIQVVEDASFLATIGVTEDERKSLQTLAEALAQVPSWVERWEIVCVTADWRPDNFGMRDAGEPGHLVTFDWGTTRLAPMEEDITVLLMRLRGQNEDLKRELVAAYLGIYGDMIGRSIEYDAFMARIPWSRVFVTLRYLLGHIQALRWAPHQTRSREFVHLFTRLCSEQLAQCRTAQGTDNV